MLYHPLIREFLRHRCHLYFSKLAERGSFKQMHKSLVSRSKSRFSRKKETLTWNLEVKIEVEISLICLSI